MLLLLFSLTAWDGSPFPSALPFYEGVDDFTADTLDRVSREVLAVKATLLKNHPHLNLDVVRHVSDWVLDAYDHHIVDKSNLRTCITSNKAYKGLTHPMKDARGGDGMSDLGGSDDDSLLQLVPDTSHRYWVEDLPCGLVATRGIAELAGVDTPFMDSVILVSERESF